MNGIPSGNDCYIAIENGHGNSEFSQIQHGDFPQFFVCLPEGIHSLLTNIDRYYIFDDSADWSPLVSLWECRLSSWACSFTRVLVAATCQVISRKYGHNMVQSPGCPKTIKHIMTYLPHAVQLPRRSQCFPSWNWVPPKKDAEVGVYPNDFLGEFTKNFIFSWGHDRFCFEGHDRNDTRPCHNLGLIRERAC